MQCFNGTASMLWLLCTCVSLSVLLSRPIYLKMFCVPPSPSSPPRLSLAVRIARRRWRAKEVRGHTCSNIGSNSIWCVPCCSASLRCHSLSCASQGAPYIGKNENSPHSLRPVSAFARALFVQAHDYLLPPLQGEKPLAPLRF